MCNTVSYADAAKEIKKAKVSGSFSALIPTGEV